MLEYKLNERYITKRNNPIIFDKINKKVHVQKIQALKTNNFFLFKSFRIRDIAINIELLV